MSRAFVDTTILTDRLLKPGERSRQAERAIRSFDTSLLPVYAIKEFKAGPLQSWIWFHNKLVTLGSFPKVIDALARMALSPRRYRTATCLEALSAWARAQVGVHVQDWVDHYGRPAQLDSILYDRLRLSLSTRILMAWSRRRSVTTEVVEPLTCYQETALELEVGLIDGRPYRCTKADPECCLAGRLKSNPGQLQALRKAVQTQPRKTENTRRAQALRSLIRNPRTPMSERTCRNLGDAVFAFLAPADAVILTTNVDDHKPLAEALGKSVATPLKES